MATVGYGATFYKDGSKVKLGDKISWAEASELLEFHLQKFWNALKTTPHWGEMTQGQKGCLLSFSFNTGWTCGADGFETLNRTIRNKAWNLVPKTLLLYVNPGTSTEAGLRRRREAEGKLWSS